MFLAFVSIWFASCRCDMLISGACIVGYLFNAIMNTTSTLLIDLVPTQGSSITACVGVSLTQTPQAFCSSSISSYKFSHTEQHRPLLPRRHRHVRHQHHPRRPQARMDARFAWGYVYRGVPLAFCGDEVGPCVAGETKETFGVARVPSW